MNLVALYVKICTGWLILLGLVGLLLTGFTGEARSLVWMEIDAVASWIHLVLGLIGTAMLTTEQRTHRFAAVVSVLFLLWALVGIVSDGSLGDWATGDPQTVAMHAALGIAGLLAIGLARWTQAATPTPER